MQQDWDDIDKRIMESKLEIKLDADYTDKLLKKLKRDNKNKDQSYIGAFSLIMAGFFALFIYTSDVQYKIAEFQTKAKSEIIDLRYNYDSFGIFKYFIGE